MCTTVPVAPCSALAWLVLCPSPPAVAIVQTLHITDVRPECVVVSTLCACPLSSQRLTAMSASVPPDQANALMRAFATAAGPLPAAAYTLPLGTAASAGASAAPEPVKRVKTYASKVRLHHRQTMSHMQHVALSWPPLLCTTTSWATM